MPTSLTVTLTADRAAAARAAAARVEITAEQFIEGLIEAYFEEFVEWVKTISPNRQN